MRKYDPLLEKNIRVERLVREWTRSGLIETSQHDGMLHSLEIPVRRTNIFLRLILFGFTVLIIVAALLLVVQVLQIENSHQAVAILCLVAAAASLALAEGLVSSFNLYRFGIEEAAAFTAAGLAAVGAGNVASTANSTFIGLIVGALCGFGIYYRFGYVYAAIASMICVTAIPFQFHFSSDTKRIIAAMTLATLWAVAHWLHRKIGDEYPGDEVGTIEAIGWFGIYAFLNLHLSPDLIFNAGRPLSPNSTFYWFTYAMVWVLPALGLLVAMRGRHRLLLDINIAMALLTLITNKSYLHAVRQPWDPIVFGAFLIGIAVVTRRWLENGPHGFTSKRLLSSDKRRIGVVAAASFAFRPDLSSGPSTPPDEPFHTGGGRSGGAGASGSF